MAVCFPVEPVEEDDNSPDVDDAVSLFQGACEHPTNPNIKQTRIIATDKKVLTLILDAKLMIYPPQIAKNNKPLSILDSPETNTKVKYKPVKYFHYQ